MSAVMMVYLLRLGYKCSRLYDERNHLESKVLAACVSGVIGLKGNVSNG